MGWLWRDPPLLPGERVLWQKKVSMGPSSGAPDLRTAIAAVLYVTSMDRVLLVPNRGNRRKYREARTWKLGDVASAGVQARDFTAYTGGLQQRLCLTMNDATELLFVCTSREEALADWQAMIAGGA